MVAALTAVTLTSAAPPTEHPAATKDIAAACGTREGWSDPAPPAHIYGNSWYVGTCGITVVLIETSAGLVLIDSGPLEATSQILASIRTLGFDPKRVKWILSTHEHFDHAGGIAALQQATGARLAVGPFAAQALRTGKPYPDDPQAALLAKYPMAPARVDRVLRDKGMLKLGDVRFTVWSTPAHSPGSTSWTWRSCEDSDCRTIAYADSVNTISSDDYRFSEHPERVSAARTAFATVAALPCDILVTPHPSASNLLLRLSGKDQLASSDACAIYAKAGQDRLTQRLARENTLK